MHPVIHPACDDDALAEYLAVLPSRWLGQPAILPLKTVHFAAFASFRHGPWVSELLAQQGVANTLTG